MASGSRPALKRFYSRVAAVRGPQGDEAENGHLVTLDGRPVRTPAGAEMVIPGRRLAEAVAEEWDAQTDRVDATSMPMMSFVATAIDRVAPQREAVAAEVAAYGASDLLCYRADSPQELVDLQEREWQPLLDWVAERFSARMAVTRGVMPLAQDNVALMLLARHVGALDSFRLAGLHALTTATGSLVLGLAVLERRLSAEAAFEAGQLDEAYQAGQWGWDAESLERRDRLRGDVLSAERLFDLLD